MREGPRRAPIGALSRTLVGLSVLAGVALWLTPATFDLVLLPSDRPVRVAMLPPLWQLPVFVLAAWLGLLAIARLLPRSAGDGASDRAPSDESRRAADRAARTAAAPADALLPAAGLGLLMLPYLPWLPDALPILRLLAGPGRALIWFTVAALIARGFWRALPSRARLADAPPARIALVLFIVGTLLSGTAATLFTRTVLYPGGDEPHYLILAQSLWRDGDLRIENNHRRGDYREYFANDLAPHYLTRGVDRQIYSVHPIGLPVLLAPVYALGGYGLVVWAMALMASAAGALAWLAAWRVTGSRATATTAWVACCLNGPWIFNSFAVYPEVPAALMVMGAWLILSGADAGPAAADAGAAGPPLPWPRWAACGAAIATLPWLSTKYAPMAGALALVALGRIWWPERLSVARVADRSETKDSLVASAALLVPLVVSLAGWLAFFHAYWGTFSPAAPYGIQRETRLAYLPRGGPGLLFDQEYGVIAFAPALLLGLTGFVAMLRAGGRARRLAIEILLIAGALLATVGAFHIWWGGSAPAGRPIISGLLLLAVPFAWRYEQQRDKPALRAAYHLLIVVGLAIGLTLALAQGGLLIAAHRSGISRVLDWLSPTWLLWNAAPSFIVQPLYAAVTATALWILAALAAGWWLSRRPRTLPPGRAMLSALAACTMTIVVMSVMSAIVPPAMGRDMLVTRLRARGRSELIDRFDGRRRPLAILYDPLDRIEPAAAPPLVEFVADARQQRPRPPIPLLYNARWSLPAGRYTIELIAGTATAAGAAASADATNAMHSSADASATGAMAGRTIDGTLSLQLGYADRAARTWEVSMAAPGVWGRTFDLLTDVNLVGFRASPELEAAAPALRIRPHAIVDVHDRLPPIEVTSTATFGDRTVYFHDARMRTEGDGFWTPASSTVVLTLTTSASQPARLLLRAGPVRTAVGLANGGWRERVALEPHGERLIALPPTRSGVMRLLVETSAGFVPATLDPASRDRRELGVWIELESAEKP